MFTCGLHSCRCSLQTFSCVDMQQCLFVCVSVIRHYVLFLSPLSFPPSSLSFSCSLSCTDTVTPMHCSLLSFSAAFLRLSVCVALCMVPQGAPLFLRGHIFAAVNYNRRKRGMLQPWRHSQPHPHPQLQPHPHPCPRPQPQPSCLIHERSSGALGFLVGEFRGTRSTTMADLFPCLFISAATAAPWVSHHLSEGSA